MLSRIFLLAFTSAVTASITIEDPTDIIAASDWASDNAIKADYNITTGASYLLTDLKAAYHFDDIDASISHEALSVNANDTSVISISEDSVVNASYITVIKEGFSSNLNQASFYGVNAAVNIANGSSLTADHVNVTVHNGAASFYAYGTGTVAYLTDIWLYSSGPVSHGLYGAGNGTIYASNVQHYSGGNRASSFSGDSGGGYIYVTDATAHTAGIGSAIAFTVGVISLTNVVGVAEQAPAMFMDSDQEVYFYNCELTAGLLAGLFFFGSSTKSSDVATGVLENSKLTVSGDTVPALWAGNTWAQITVNSSILTTDSGILAVSNYSQTTQEFDFYAGYADNNDLSPATLEVTVIESDLAGDIVAYNGSTISWTLNNYSSWTGTAYAGDSNNAVEFAVALDDTSNWTLTADTTLQNFTDSVTNLTNIYDNGFSIYYDASSSENSWLSNKTITLQDGGVVTPS